MPQFGTGILPSGNAGTELSYITRRGFIPKMVVQIYNASPTIAALLANAMTASGGVSPITCPVQGKAFVTPQWTDYSGSFNSPSVTQGAYNAEFNLKALVVPVPFLGMEGLVQITEAVIPRIEAVMNDATNGAIDTLATALYGNITNNQQIIGLAGAIDNGTSLTTYGGLSRSTNTWWQSNSIAAGSVAPTRNLVLKDIVSLVKKCGEKPTFGVTGPGTWHNLATDFVSNERYLVSPDGAYGDNQFGARGAFQALMVGGVPIYFDQYATEGTIYYFNQDYGGLYVHEDAAFGFTGFESTLPNFQLGYIGAVLSLLELVLAKPKAFGVTTGYNFTTL